MPDVPTLRGIVPSLNTPFLPDGRIDIGGLGRLVDHTVAAGCAGMLILAVASEMATLSLNERRCAAKAIVERNAGRIPIVLSVTADDPAMRRALARFGRELGVLALCCQVPAGLSGMALEAELREIAEAGPGLLMIQDLDWSGSGLAIATIQSLFERLPAFRFLKLETVPSGPKYTSVLEATGGRLHVSGGWAVAQMMEALARGVHAFMPTGFEPIYVTIYRHWIAGRAAEAEALFERLLPVLAFTNQHIHVSIRFLKQLRRAEGLFATDLCRPPVPEFDAFQQHQADRLLTRALELQDAVRRDIV
ncbi:MAG: dihydrodipicolinate synthase family protein [Alphaproteobacteria bacterium]|nr:dihydrodipicolinate synthase family protein [Alphaproteobacteria bacterium]